jgi:hypothetical protein
MGIAGDRSAYDPERGSCHWACPAAEVFCCSAASGPCPPAASHPQSRRKSALRRPLRREITALAGGSPQGEPASTRNGCDVSSIAGSLSDEGRTDGERRRTPRGHAIPRESGMTPGGQSLHFCRKQRPAPLCGRLTSDSGGPKRICHCLL